MSRKPDEAFRGRWQRLYDGLEQSYPDGELYEERSQATYGVDAVCLIDFHSGAGELLPVVLVLFLQLLELRLKSGHLHHLAGSGELSEG